MYKSEFDKLLKDELTFEGYLFHGEDPFLVEEYGLKTALKLANGDDVTKLYFDEYNFNIAINFLSQSSLFSENNILFLKISKKIQKKDLDKLLEVCNYNPNSKIVISAIGDVDFRSMETRFSKKNNSLYVRFYKLKDFEAINFLKEYSVKENLQIEIQGLEFLYTMHNKDLGLCISDLRKLTILDEQITSKTISQHCFGLGSVNLEDFLEKIFTLKPINKDLYNILEEGMNEVQLVSRIMQYTQMLLMVNIYLRIYGELNIQEIWGYNLPKIVAQKYANIAMRFKQTEYVKMLNFLSELELELKSSKLVDLNGYIQSKLRNFLRNY